MQIMCVDQSSWGLAELKRTVKHIIPEAHISGCRDPKKALECARKDGCDTLLTEIDFGGPRWEGLELAEQIQKLNPRVNIIFVTDCPEREYAEELIRLRISGYVRKPYNSQKLAEELENLRYSEK